MDKRKHIVVIGAGFGGLSFCKKIDKHKYDVTLIDRNDYHSFPPLFYQVASGMLESSDISFALRRECRSRKMRGCRYRLGTVSAIDCRAKTVITDNGEIGYDILVIAAGTTNNFFGNDVLRRYVCTLKSTSEAIRTRNEILLRLEHAVTCNDETRRRSLLTFAVIGGGPTGVEIAGALSEARRYTIPKEYPSIDSNDVRVILIEGSDRLLRTMSRDSSAIAMRDLKNMGVEIMTGVIMKDYDGQTITLSDGNKIQTSTVIWSAGVSCVDLGIANADIQTVSGGRLVVDEYNLVKGTDSVYAVGDISAYVDGNDNHGCPQLAPVAIQQGDRLARNLNNHAKRQRFVYKDKGSMATIGRNHAVVDMYKLHFGGWFAWIVWMTVHLMSLLGMRNKVIVMFNWIWAYVTHSPSQRMILRPSKYPDNDNSCSQ